MPLEVPTRIPPHNLDAERAVLGAVLLEGREALPRVVEVLRASDFYTEAHRAMYQAMLTLFDRGAPVDSLTLSEELRRTDQLQFIGGPAAIALLMEEASSAPTSGRSTSPALPPASRSSTSRPRASSRRTSSSSPAARAWARRSRSTRG